MVETVLCIWGAWVFVHVTIFLLGVLFAEYQYPVFDGFRVHIPDQIINQVTREELAAAIMHEYGHREYWHVWENLLRLCLFFPVSTRRRIQQELEADDFVLDSVSLAMFLCKISQHPFDLYRAERLIARAKQRSQLGGHPSRGMRGSNPPKGTT